MTLTKALAAAAILSMAATPVYAAKSNNAAAKLSLEQPNVYPAGATAGQLPARTKASKATVPRIVAGVAVVVGAAVLLGQNGSTPASR
jgi:hypothetical protein